MHLIQKIKKQFARNGPISKINENFQSSELPCEIQMKYDGQRGGGYNTDRFSISPKRGGKVGDSLIRIEYTVKEDVWKITKPYSAEVLSEVEGRESYEKLATAIVEELKKQM